MSIYKPTWLMIKQHNQTGLKYFCKTVQKDPYKYKGSGKYWRLHLAKHGKDVSTVWLQLFPDQTELINFALTFSHENNIVESKEWANLIPENGVGGGCSHGPLSEETKKKIAKGNTGKIMSAITRRKNSESNRNRGPRSDETKTKIGNSNRMKCINRRWWTNGIENKWVIDEVSIPGWSLGRTIHSKKD